MSVRRAWPSIIAATSSASSQGGAGASSPARGHSSVCCRRKNSYAFLPSAWRHGTSWSRCSSAAAPCFRAVFMPRRLAASPDNAIPISVPYSYSKYVRRECRSPSSCCGTLVDAVCEAADDVFCCTRGVGAMRKHVAPCERTCQDTRLPQHISRGVLTDKCGSCISLT